MSFYQKLAKVGQRFIPKHILFKYAFNWSPMYRRTTGKVTFVSKDLFRMNIELPISYKNRNFVGSIFGGSLFSSVDPMPMVQLINILGDDYVVWDKTAEIKFKRPGKEKLYAEFTYHQEEIDRIKEQVAQQQEIEITKTTQLTTKDRDIVICEVTKTIYVADKKSYKQKLAKRKARHQNPL